MPCHASLFRVDCVAVLIGLANRASIAIEVLLLFCRSTAFGASAKGLHPYLSFTVRATG